MTIEPGRIVNDFIEPNRNQYVIPVYQRNYEWSLDDCKKLFEDIINAHKRGKLHFCGSIVYAPLSTGLNLQSYVIIDGQQRLTTLVLFMKVLCLMTDSDDLFRKDFILEKGSIALQHGKNDIDAFSKVVNAASIDEIKKLDANSRIVEAAHFFIDNMKPDKAIQSNTNSSR